MRPITVSSKKLGSLAAALAFALTGCTSIYPMTSEPIARFASGEVDAVFEDDGTGRMIVRVDHLGDPGKIDPRATTYVVWMQAMTDGTEAQNLGPLQTDANFRGRVKFATPLKHFRVWITCEANAAVTKPTGATVLSGEILRQ
jgi:hypothetical protein